MSYPFSTISRSPFYVSVNVNIPDVRIFKSVVYLECRQYFIVNLNLHLDSSQFHPFHVASFSSVVHSSDTVFAKILLTFETWFSHTPRTGLAESKAIYLNALAMVRPKFLQSVDLGMDIVKVMASCNNRATVHYNCRMIVLLVVRFTTQFHRQAFKHSL